MIVTLLVGKFSEIDVDRLIKSYQNEFPVIVSTWKNQVTDEQIIKLKDAGFDLVLSESIESNFSINLQLKTIRAGLNFIKENYECDIIIKSRIDIYPVNYDKFIEYILNNQDDKLFVLFKVYFSFLYYLDLIVVGRKDQIFKFYNIKDSPFDAFPELYLIHTYTGLIPKTYTHEYYEKHLKFIGRDLRSRNIDFIWQRNKDNFDKCPMDFLPDYRLRVDNQDYNVSLINDLSRARYIIN